MRRRARVRRWRRGRRSLDHPAPVGTQDANGTGLSSDALLAGRLRAALDLVEDGVVVCDGLGDTVFRNATAERHLGVSSDSVLAEQAVGDALLLALQGDYPERTLDLFSPTQRKLIIRAFPLAGLDRPDGAVAIVQDASDRHRLEAIRRDFVANVSHELKTPVGALSLLAETLDGEDDPEVVDRLAKRVAAEAERLGRIIDDLLDLSRIEANETPRQEMVPLTRHCRSGGRAAARRGRPSEVGLDVDDPPRHLAVPGDRRDLVSAVSNLVDNAIKYSERGSLVQVRVRRRTAGRWRSLLSTRVSASRPATWSGSSSGSTGSTGPGPALPGGPGLGCPSSATWRSTTPVRCGSSRSEGEGSVFTLRLPARSVASGPAGVDPAVRSVADEVTRRRHHA